MDIDSARLEQVAARIPDALQLPVDFSDSANVDAAIKEVVSHFGRLDWMAHVGAVDVEQEIKKRTGQRIIDVAEGREAGFDATMELTDAQWHRMITINLDGAFYCIRAALREMIPARYGSIVAVSSLGGITGPRGTAHYSAAKAGVLALTRCVAKEVIGYGIRVNALAPGAVDTPMLARSPEAFWKGAAAAPIGRPAAPAEIAEAISFLLSDSASYIAGETLNVNGGALTI